MMGAGSSELGQLTTVNAALLDGEKAPIGVTTTFF
jgi:hypothetical protein